MKRFIFILSITLFLINCGKNTGPERTKGLEPNQPLPPTTQVPPPNAPEIIPNNPPLDNQQQPPIENDPVIDQPPIILPPIFINYYSIKTDKDFLFFGLNDFNNEKTKQLIVSNNGNSDLNNLLITSSGDSQITIDASNCINRTIQVNDSCIIYLKFIDTTVISKSAKKTITISFGTVSKTVTSYGYSFDFNSIDSMIESIISKQVYDNDPINNIFLGSWRSDENVSYLINNIFISNILLKSRNYYRGDLNPNSFNSLYSKDLNITDQNIDNWKVLDKSLSFIFINDKNTEIKSDDSFISLNKNSILNDSDITIQKWVSSNSGLSKPKELSPPLIEVINNIYKTIYSNDLLDYSLIDSDYLFSRKLINNNLESIQDISAQLSYILDFNRISPFNYLENGLKEIDFYFNYFNSRNDSFNLSKISKYYIDHWEYNFNELNQDTLKYNPIEFDYGSFVIAGSNSTNLNNDKLSWIIDYSRDWFTNSYPCRDISYALLNLVNSYNYGQLTYDEKIRVSNLIKDGIIELKNSQACFYNETSKNFLSQENDNGGFNSNNGIPIILKIYHNIPESIIGVDEKIAIYNQLLIELSSKSLDIKNQNNNPLYTAEIIRALLELKDL